MCKLPYEIKKLSENPEYEEGFYAMQKEYLPDTDTEQCRKYSVLYEEVYLICCKEKELIGICYGWPRAEEDPADPSFTLQGICIKWDEAAKGLGSKLLKAFEKGAEKSGYPVVGVGSAPGYVEHFYAKNGYVPVCYKEFDEAGNCRVTELATKEAYENLKRSNNGFVVFTKR